MRKAEFGEMLEFIVTEKQRESKKLNSLVLGKNKHIHGMGVIDFQYRDQCIKYSYELIKQYLT